MAVLSNDKQVFGSIVPAIYINKINLENGASVHNPRKFDRVAAHIDNKAAPGVVTSEINEKYYEDGSHPLQSSKVLTLTIDYVVKDAIDGSIGTLLSTWSSAGDLQKYTDVYFALVDDSLAAKLLSVGSNISKTSNQTKLKKSLLFGIAPLIKQGLLSDADIQKLGTMGIAASSFQMPYSGIQYKNGSNIEFASNIILDFVNKSIVTSNKMNLRGILEQSVFSSDLEIDDDGKKIKNYRFSKKYQYPTDTPNDLTIVAACSLNLDNLEEDFGLDLSFIKSSGTTVGKRAIQDIFHNGKITSTNSMFMLKSNSQIWTGQVYKAEGGRFFTTPLELTGQGGQELVKKSVPNNKVHDFRISEQIQKIKFDLSFLQTNDFSLAESHKITRDKTDVYKSPPYFTKNYVSRDYDGNARFMFGVDYYSLVRDLTNFGNFLEPTPTNVFSIISHRKIAQILNLSIKRKRVDLVPRSNRLGTYNAKEVPFRTGYLGEPHIDTEKAISILCAGSETIAPNGVADIFTSNSAVDSNVNDLSNGSIEELSIRTPDLGADAGILGFRFFSGDDYEIKNFTEGKYQYGIEMEILDRSHIFIINSIISLIQAYKALSIYYTEASTPNIYYNVRTGKFKNSLITKYATQEFKPWTRAASALVSVISKYKNPSSIIDLEEIKSQLMRMTKPSTGTPRGIETLSKLIINAASKLSGIVGSSLNTAVISQISAGSDKIAISADSILSSKPDKRIIKVEYWVDDVFDTEVPKRFGYDFLQATGHSHAHSKRGIHTIPGGTFNFRIEQEMLKYYNHKHPSSFEIVSTAGASLTPGDTIFNSLFSYLSPCSISLGVSSGGDPNDITGLTPPRYNLLDSFTQFEADLLGGDKADKPFYDRKGYTYVATKIMSYNSTAILPPYDSTINQNKNTLLSQAADKMKYHTQQILTNRNCVAVMKYGKAEPAPTDPTSPFGLLMSTFLGPQIDAADPIENNLSYTKHELTDNDPINISYKGGAEVSTFLSFVYGYSNQCGGITSTRKPSTLTDSKERPFDIKFFVPNASIGKSIVKQINKNMNDEQINPLSRPAELQKRLKELPNQIKSLLLTENPSARVKHKWLNLSGNPSTDVYYKACFAFNYQNIKRIEYLAGYDYAQPPKSAVISFDSEGSFTTTPGTPAQRPMIGRPIWKTLNADVYTAAINKNLFCRLRTYSKPEFGIAPVECLEMPVFDEFFILKPESYDGTFLGDANIASAVSILPETSEEQQEPNEDYANSTFFISDPPLEEQVQIEQGGLFTSDSGMDPGERVDFFGAGIIPGFVGGAAGGVDVGTGADFGTDDSPFTTAVGQMGAGSFGTLGGSGSGIPGVKGGPLGPGGDDFLGGDFWLETITIKDI